MTQVPALPKSKAMPAPKPYIVDFPKGGIGPKFTKKVLPWVEQFWHEKKRYPSEVDFAQRFGLTAEQTNMLNNSRFWLNCLKDRGITLPTQDAAHLTERQVAAIALITNFNDLRSPVARLASIGVTNEELQGWYSNPHFKNALASRAEDVFDNIAPDATVELARAIKRGNFQAIKFYYEITGKAASPEALNVKQTMQILIEAVQKHVKDPETLQAIAGEVQNLRSIQGL